MTENKKAPAEKSLALMEKIEVLSGASGESRRALLKESRLLSLKKNRTVFSEGDSLEAVYFVAEGFAVLYRMAHSLDKKAIFVCAEGEMLNGEALMEPVSVVSCRVLSDRAQILAIRRTAFLEVMRKDRDLYDAVFFSVAKKLRRTYRQLGNTAGGVHLDRQIAARLYKLGRDHGIPSDDGKGLTVAFPLSITFLAELVGSRRETVSRVIRDMARQGLVRADRKGFWIAGLDRIQRYIYEEKIGKEA